MPIIKLKNFDGPFDLLLHLIKKNEMNINDVKIHDITKQYLEYITVMKELDLEITSEFIVIAATLIEIKSKALLPKIKNDQEENEEDMKKNLLDKLVEYKKIKKIANFLRSKELSTGNVFTKKPEIIEETKEVVFDKNYLNNITMLQLYKIYNNLISMYGEKQNTTVIEKKISVDKYKIEEKIHLIKEKLEKENILKFSKVIYECECKLEVVVTFLALLELIKENDIKAMQYNSFGEIIVEKVIK